jgi:hypothetical protein
MPGLRCWDFIWDTWFCVVACLGEYPMICYAYSWSSESLFSNACCLFLLPQVWYAVPGQASEAFEAAVADCLPHLAAADPVLLTHQPVAVSPNELSARGLPVSR